MRIAGSTARESEYFVNLDTIYSKDGTGYNDYPALAMEARS